MAEYAQSGAWSSRDWASHDARRSRHAETGLQVFLGVALGLTLLALAFGLLILPATRLKRIQVEGLEGQAAAELSSLAGLDGMPWLFSIDTVAVESAVSAHPEVASVRAVLRPPSTLALLVEPRTAVAMVLGAQDGRIRPLLVDRGGVVFAAAGARDAAALPLLSGIRFEDFRFGARLPEGILPLLQALETLGGEEPLLLSALSELRLVRKAYGGFEVLVYTMDYRVPARTGPELNGNLLRSILLVLDVIEARGDADSVSELDFRTGTVVYRSKEGLSG